MAESVKLKSHNPTAPAPTATAAAPPAKLPELSDSPRYREAEANLLRLKLECERLEKLRDNYAAIRSAALEARKHGVQALLGGKTASEVRREANVSDADFARAHEDLRLTRRAVEAAEQELNRITATVKDEIAAPFAAHWRSRVRATALAWLAYVRLAADLDEIRDHLSGRGLLEHGGLTSALPPFRGGNPARLDSQSAFVIRELLDAQILDERADAELLRGLAIAPKPIIPFTPAPKPAPKKLTREEQIAKSGVATDTEWSAM